MTSKHLSRSPPVRRTRSCSLDNRRTSTKEKNNYGELIGGSAAECTAVFCCFPMGVMEFLVLGLYKVPTGLCKKAGSKMKKRNGRHKSQDMYPTPAMYDLDMEVCRMVKGQVQSGGHDDRPTGVVDSEEEILDRFVGTGFWREPSQNENTSCGGQK